MLADLVERAHLLHLLDDALLAQVVQVANDECSEGALVMLKLVLACFDSIFAASL